MLNLKNAICGLLNKNEKYRWVYYWLKINRIHKQKEKRCIRDKSKPIYYIIGWDDPQCSGWTVYERVVLYGSIYAIDHNMIPVVDMKNYKSIYQQKEDYQKVNIWDKYYFQPSNISLEDALASENYVLADSSPEWFCYLRMRRPKKTTEGYLREQYSKYIRLRPEIIDICEKRLSALIPEAATNIRMLAVRLRGTDYVKYQHAVQPDIKEVAELAKKKMSEYNCKYIFLSTEDRRLFEKAKQLLPKNKVITYNSGNVEKVDGFVGEYMAKVSGIHEASLDYITTLYIINKCCCLIGGVHGATIVARYRRNPPYEYINIIDLKQHYLGY